MTKDLTGIALRHIDVITMEIVLVECFWMTFSAVIPMRSALVDLKLRAQSGHTFRVRVLSWLPVMINENPVNRRVNLAAFCCVYYTHRVDPPLAPQNQPALANTNMH